MKFITSYLSILFFIIALSFGIGCDNASKQSDTKNEQGDTAAKTDDNNTSKRRFISIGTGTLGGAFYTIGGAIADVVSRNITDKNWEVTAEGTKGTQENIRLLVRKDATLEFALANAAISYFAVRGEGAWQTEQPIRAVMTLAPNVALFVTPKSSGIRTMADLKGKRVVVGPAGAGFEYFLGPILAEHGVTYDDFTPLNDIYSAAVNLLADRSAAAAFIGGAVPTPAVEQASATQDILFIPFDETAKQALVDKYPFFNSMTIPASAYKNVLTEPFDTMNVGSMHLITSENADEDTVYHFTKTLYTHRAEVVKAHKAGKAINEKNAVKDVGTPFHPGAIRFYKEIGIWSE
ncbi:TAXI family TRAP transporter solute-binding subunit [Candidatus Poribacteria bacterium]|nr:TAXI family TRAP transporter solute-binding subunit [Candidatus Poribacteria bacterium]